MIKQIKAGAVKSVTRERNGIHVHANQDSCWVKITLPARKVSMSFTHITAYANHTEFVIL